MNQSDAFYIACNTQALVDNCALINKMHCKHVGFHKVSSLLFFFSALGCRNMKLNPDPDVLPNALQIPADLHMRKGLA